MALFGKFRNRWRIAGLMAEAEADGEALIRVPGHLAATVKQYAWQLQVAKAADRWAARVDGIPLTQWQAGLQEAGRHRAGKPRHG